MSDALQSFIQCLKQADPLLAAEVGLGPGVEDIADMLWLAAQLPAPAVDSNPVDATPPPLADPVPAHSPSATESAGNYVYEDAADAPGSASAAVGTLVTPASLAKASSSQTDTVKPLTIPAAAALRHPLRIARSLRRLGRKVVSRTQTVIDEEATAIAMAEGHPVGIIERPAQEQWLTLELVIERSRVAAIWDQTSREFAELLSCLGTFRTVRVWTLDTDAANPDHPLPVLTAGQPPRGHRTQGEASAASPRRGTYRELIDPSGQGLVMVLSDCISPLWRSGMIHPWLADWARQGPTVVVQWFPEAYWTRTGLKAGDVVWLSALTPGIPSDRLTRDYLGLDPEDWLGEDWEDEGKPSMETVTFPVVSLDPQSLGEWTRVVTGCGNAQVQGRRFEIHRDNQGNRWGPHRPPRPLPSDGRVRLRLFRETASSIAQELAGLMSLAPVSPEITHLIQETLLPQSSSVHVAEVFLSGLLEPTDDGAYLFVSGVKGQLQQSMLQVDEALVFRVLSRYIATHYGQTPREFNAFLRQHQEWDEREWNQLDGFAELRQRLPQTDAERADSRVEKTVGKEADPQPLHPRMASNSDRSEAQPEETQPEEAQPEETRFEETRFEETRFEETQPEETQPEEVTIRRSATISTFLLPGQIDPLLNALEAQLGQIDGKTKLPHDQRAVLYACLRYGNVPYRRMPELLREDHDRVYNWRNLKSAGTLIFNRLSKLFGEAIQKQGCARQLVAWYNNRDIRSPMREPGTALDDAYHGNFVLDPVSIRLAHVVQQRGEWTIQYQAAQARRFVESLPGGVSLELVAIPAGAFMMGSPVQEPGRGDRELSHPVTLAYSFLMSRYPITQAQWRAVSTLGRAQRKLDPNPSRFKYKAHHPVERISWYDAQEFCDRLNQYFAAARVDRKEYFYRLPSEAEWEYACRAGTTTPFYFGAMITPAVANYNSTHRTTRYGGSFQVRAREQTNAVSAFSHANVFGLSDMHGNISEWCLDHWHKTYHYAPKDGSARIKNRMGHHRVCRGGSWQDRPEQCRAAARHHYSPDEKASNLGFRVVLAHAVLS